MAIKNPHPTILIAEDNKDMAGILVQLLEAEGYETKVACNGGGIFDFLRKGTPDLILLDIMMPGVDGAETLLKIKSQPRTQDIPVIICTGLDDMNSVEKFFNWGAADYILKPFDNERVLQKVRKFCG